MTATEPTPAAATAPAAAPEVPAGWDHLPAGPTRTIRVLKDAIGLAESSPFRVENPADFDFGYYREVRVLGPVEFVHHPDMVWCGRTGVVEARTTAAVLARP